MTDARRRPARAAVLALALLLAAAQAACMRGGRPPNPLDVVAPELDVDQERELGYEFDQAMQKDVRVVDDPVVAGFVNDLGRELLQGAGHQPHIYRFRVVQDPSLNAFALMGGYVYIHSGTLAAASSVDELAGVMGHEIGHVKLRHHARMEKQTQLPKLLSTLAGVAGAAVTGQPGILLASQGINVALELSFSREFESEADREGVRLAGAAGMRPDAMARFFERIVAVERADPERIPPYLYSHPDVEKRIDTVEMMARRVEVTPKDNDAMRAGFEAAKARLVQLQEGHGAPVISARPADADTEALLTAAETAASAEQHERAVELLRNAAQRAPSDPRISFRIGELEAQAGHDEEAAAAFRRTIEIDPTRALVFYRLGEVSKAQGDAQLAIYAFGQASRRAGEKGTLRARADWEVVKLTFPLVVESGLTGSSGSLLHRGLGAAVEHYPVGARQMTWWGSLGRRYLERAKELRARWLPPGATSGEELPIHIDDTYVHSTLDLPEPGATAGKWTLEIVLDNDVLLRRTVPVGVAPGPAATTPSHGAATL